MSCVNRFAVLLFAFAGVAAADTAPWQFGTPVTVADARPGVFHHLESAGRRSIAVSGDAVAVVWEDNRDGTPRAYVAFRTGAASDFQGMRLSGEGEAYEPAVTGLENGRFVFGWEEAGQAWVRSGGPLGLDPPVRLGREAGAQVTLARGERGVYVAWAKQTGKVMAIHVARLTPGRDGAPITFSRPVIVTPQLQVEQLYPALAVLKSATVVAWEDRRHGHTVIYAAQSRDDRRFSAARRVNEQLPRRSTTFGRGTGAARVVLARLGAERAAAVWLDKRDFEGGYDIYAAVTTDAGRLFGKNLPVVDDFGRSFGQWHAALAVDSQGRQVCVWDDDRDGSPDLWFSWRSDGPWTENLGVPGASGPELETSPVLAFDDQGGLHLAWIEQVAAGGPTRLRYRHAPVAQTRP